MSDLSGKSVLLTGASGGIGQAIARELHGQGAELVLSGRRRDVLEKLASALESKTHIITAALDDRQAVGDLVKQAEHIMGKIDILINNAGQTKDNLAIRLSDQDWDDVIAVDLTSGFLLARACLRGMIKRRWGRIISISSVVGQAGNRGQANYAAAKAGLTAMSKSLAQEVASRSVTVNCVAPGFIKTAMTEGLPEKTLLETIPAARLGRGEDVAAAVGFLASEKAAYITGQTIHVNGGMIMP